MTVAELALAPRTRPEKDEERAGDDMVARLGGSVVRLSQPRNTMQTPGVADRRYYLKFKYPAAGGAFLDASCKIWWEAKSETGKQTEAEWDFQQMVEGHGEWYVLGPSRVLAAFLCWMAQLVQSDVGGSERPDRALDEPYRYRRPKRRIASRLGPNSPLHEL